MTVPGADLLAAWEQTRQALSDAPAVLDTRGAAQRTFADIETEAAELAATALSKFIAGSVVGIQIGNHPAWPAAWLACCRRGLVALPLERTITPQEREAALRVCHAAGLITDTTDDQITTASLAYEPVQWGEHVPILLKLTSGTTAAPRAIRFRSAQVVADCTQICDTMGITERDLNYGVIPVSHSYGFSNLITPLVVRGVPLVMSRDRMPRAVLDGLARTGATVFPGMPVFYQAFCGLPNVPAMPRLRLCLSAGAPLPLPVAQRFRERFGHAIHSFYGSSECGGICYDREAPLEQQGFVGQPMLGVELEPLDAGSSTTRIRVHSAAAGDGYFPEPDAACLGHGQFTPDDLMSETPAGFRIVGRASDLINVAGKKVNPAEVETALLAFAGVREAVAFGRQSTLRNEEVSACVVADAPVSEAELLEFCRRRLSGWQVPKRIFFLTEMPVTERGKISRRALAKRFVTPSAL
ncbi:MAG: acyl--CoA ligase [Verrucomicrobiota bacterium]|nr:acyl--CoA ligase [Verrucomicrobiota bacterium]